MDLCQSVDDRTDSTPNNDMILMVFLFCTIICAIICAIICGIASTGEGEGGLDMEDKWCLI